MVNEKQTVYKVTKGKYKGQLIVKTSYEMPKKIFVRGIKPLSFDKLFGYDIYGKVRSSVRIPYPEFKVNKTFLEPVGTVMINKCFSNPNGILYCKSNGFSLLEKYSGKNKDQMKKLESSYKMPTDYKTKIKFYN